MKANEVLKLLQISRMTLYRWSEKGIIKKRQLPTGHYDYDADSVYQLLNKGEARGVYLYGRVSTHKQKADLQNQMATLNNFAMNNGYQIKGAFSDIASGISFKNRKEFFKLLDLVIAGKVSTIIITYKDRLSRIGFDLFEHLFKYYHVQIIFISDLNDKKTDQQEFFKELIDFFESFYLKLNPEKINKIKQQLKQDSKHED